MIGIAHSSGGYDQISRYGVLSDVVASWRNVGGYWSMSWRLAASEAYSNLHTYAAEWLGQKCRNFDWDWYGIVTEIRYSVGWLQYRQTLTGDYANRVAVVYSGGITSWVEDTNETEIYGDWELVQQNSDLDATTGADYATRLLAKRTDARATVIGVNRGYYELPVIEFVAYGALPAAARFASGYAEGSDTIGHQVDAAGTDTISGTITSVIGDTDLTALSIETNSDTLLPEELTGLNAWARLEELATWDNLTDYTLTVNPDGGVSYYTTPGSETDPEYLITVSDIRKGGRALEQGEARPGWYKSALTGEAFFVEEVEQALNEPIARLRPAGAEVDVLMDIRGTGTRRNAGGTPPPPTPPPGQEYVS